MFKRVFGIVALLIGLLVFLISGNGPLEGPVGLTIGLFGGALLCVVGGVLIGKSVLEHRE